MALLIPEAEVGIVAPRGPGNVELVEDGQHITSPVIGQLTVYGFIDTPLAAEQLQTVFLRCLDGIFELLTDLVDVPILFCVGLQLILDLVRSGIEVFF